MERKYSSQSHFVCPIKNAYIFRSILFCMILKFLYYRTNRNLSNKFHIECFWRSTLKKYRYLNHKRQKKKKDKQNKTGRVLKSETSNIGPQNGTPIFLFFPTGRKGVSSFGGTWKLMSVKIKLELHLYGEIILAKFC